MAPFKVQEKRINTNYYVLSVEYIYKGCEEQTEEKNERF